MLSHIAPISYSALWNTYFRLVKYPYILSACMESSVLTSLSETQLSPWDSGSPGAFGS